MPLVECDYIYLRTYILSRCVQESLCRLRNGATSTDTTHNTARRGD